MPVCEDSKRSKQNSATTAHRALSVCEWPALSMPQGSAKSNAASAVCSRCGGACTGGCATDGLLVFRDYGFAGQVVQLFRGANSTRQPQRTGSCQCVSGQPWVYHGALQGQMQPLQCAAGVVGPAWGAAARLGRWFVGLAALPFCGDFQRRRQRSATTAHRALPVCEWPVPVMPLDSARSNADSAV